jgi:hypothetical protein
MLLAVKSKARMSSQKQIPVRNLREEETKVSLDNATLL